MANDELSAGAQNRHTTVTVVRVVKVGGSLLDWAELPNVLRNWLNRQTDMSTILLAGGGEWADLVRAADKRFDIGIEPSHWLCVRAMSVTAGLLGRLLSLDRTFDFEEIIGYRPSMDTTENANVCLREALPAWIPLDATTFMRDFESKCPGAQLPRTWAATSDSIAARLAEVLGARDLVVLKSTLPDHQNRTIERAVEAGFVDAHFPIAAASLPSVRFVNLRGKAGKEWRV